jgi:hypothetical protein
MRPHAISRTWPARALVSVAVPNPSVASRANPITSHARGTGLERDGHSHGRSRGLGSPTVRARPAASVRRRSKCTRHGNFLGQRNMGCFQATRRAEIDAVDSSGVMDVTRMYMLTHMGHGHANAMT